MKKLISLLLAMVLCLSVMTGAISVSAETTDLLNKTFESEGDLTWAPLGSYKPEGSDQYVPTVTASIEPAGGYNGTGGIKYTAVAGIASSSSSNQYRFFNAPSLTFKKGGTYTISFWGKASTANVSAWCAPNFPFKDEKGANLNYPSNTCVFTTEWKKFSWTFSIKSFTSKVNNVHVDVEDATKTTTAMMANFYNFPEGVEVWIDDFTITESIGEVYAIDLSDTQTTVLTVGDTTQLAVKAIDVFGDVMTNPEITYTSANTDVATVSETGLVTAHKNGVAVITAKGAHAEKSIVIIVGTLDSTNGWEAGSTVSTNITSETWGHPGYKWTEAQEIDTTKKRVGTGSLHLKQLTRPTVEQYDSTNKAYISGTVDTATRGAKFSIKYESTKISYGAQAYWFYTDNQPGNFWLQFYSNPDSSTGEKRFNFSVVTTDAKNYLPMGDGYTGTVNRTIAQEPGTWHQLVQVSTPTGHQIYVDGELMISDNKTNQKLGSITVHRIINKNETDTPNELWIDDLNVVNIIAEHDVTVNVGENGTVTHGEENVADGDVIKVIDGNNLTLTLAPDSGYKAKVKVDGQEVVVQDDNTVTIGNITSAKTVDVSFEKNITAPSVSGTEAENIKSGEYGDNKEFSYVAYYTIDLPANYTLNECGMYFNKAGAETNALKLPAVNATTLQFAIRVFGKAVQQDSSYTFQGYAEYTDDKGSTGTVATDVVTK